MYSAMVMTINQGIVPRLKLWKKGRRSFEKRGYALIVQNPTTELENAKVRTATIVERNITAQSATKSTQKQRTKKQCVQQMINQ